MAIIEPSDAYAIILPCCIIGLIYAIFNFMILKKINILSP